jgi:UDP-N-acetylmuramoyl-L-alanyl-D-glutamate--2,6-diaminopimelate ligase
MRIAETLIHSYKRPRIAIANPEDEVGARVLALPADIRLPFSLASARPFETKEASALMTWKGASFEIPFPGEFSILNATAAATLADALGVPPETVARALSRMKPILGRVEMINEGQPFLAVVDYAHTPDSLRALYSAFGSQRKICVLGNTGGGRDKWKRPLMGQIADESCAEVILTNEDPYDEDPHAIMEEMAAGMKRKPEIIVDRREAIRRALTMGRAGDAVLISGKGTDPFIMEAHGKRTPWSDSAVVREELRKLKAAE